MKEQSFFEKWSKVIKKRLLRESGWEKEFEGLLSNFGSYEGGIFFNANISLEDLLNKYLKVIDESYPHDKNYESPKVKIKCKDGCIQIERI